MPRISRIKSQGFPPSTFVILWQETFHMQYLFIYIILVYLRTRLHLFKFKGRLLSLIETTAGESFRAKPIYLFYVLIYIT